MALENYFVKEIEYKTAMEMVIKNHYLHRKSQASYRYGLFNDENILIGCITYGVPASRALCIGIAGIEESKNVLELTRLWVDDQTPKNAESYFIGQTLKLLPKDKDIIVSYAEINAGHTGIVYQATNWLYTGMSDKHIEWRIKGIEPKHSRHLLDEYGGVTNAKKILGEQLERHERPRKHRYIMLRGNKQRKRELRAKLRYKQFEYPKVAL